MLGKVVVRVVTGLIVGLVLGVMGVVYAVWHVARLDDRQHADAIIVLGAAQYNGTPSSIFQYRLGHALRLYQAGYAGTIVTVGGGRTGDTYTEAVAGRYWLIHNGAPAAAVVAVPAGSNTLTSAEALGPVFAKHGWTSAVVVSDPWHTLRSTLMIGDQGIVTHGSPTRSGPAVQTRSTELQYIVRETAAILYYGITGNSTETGPGIG